MGVLIEGANVVIRNATVEARLAGGMQEYERRCPNRTFCTDGEICRVGFMTITDAASYVESLESPGFRRPTPEGSPEVALISQTAGFDHPCDWLELGRLDLGDGQSAEVASLRGTTLSTLVAPPGWTPGKMRQIRVAEYEFLGTKGDVDVFRHKATGELRYVGRTQEGAPPAHISRAAIQDRFMSLADELARLGAFEGASADDYQGELAALHQRAKQLVEDTQASEPGPLQLQGIAARLLLQWDEAASLFRRVTEMRPEYVDGWLELTWALASLRRFEEAERAARKAVDLVPDRADALSNLAAALLEQGRLDEAQQMAEKAVAVDPADAKCRAVLAAVTVARGRPSWRLSGTRHDDTTSG